MVSSRPRVHLRQIAIATPCHVDWSTMQGDAATRFCGSCKKHVHNLSEMTEEQVTALLDAAGSSDACVRYYHRPDGTIVTSACPPHAQRGSRVATAGVAGALAYSAAFVGLSAVVAPAATTAAAASDRDDGIRVAMGGLRLEIRPPRKRMEPHAASDARPSLAEEAPTAVQLDVPSPPPARPLWPVAAAFALLAVAYVLGVRAFL